MILTLASWTVPLMECILAYFNLPSFVFLSWFGCFHSFLLWICVFVSHHHSNAWCLLCYPSWTFQLPVDTMLFSLWLQICNEFFDSFNHAHQTYLRLLFSVFYVELPLFSNALDALFNILLPFPPLLHTFLGYSCLCSRWEVFIGWWFFWKFNVCVSMSSLGGNCTWWCVLAFMHSKSLFGALWCFWVQDFLFFTLYSWVSVIQWLTYTVPCAKCVLKMEYVCFTISWWLIILVELCLYGVNPSISAVHILILFFVTRSTPPQLSCCVIQDPLWLFGVLCCTKSSWIWWSSCSMLHAFLYLSSPHLLLTVMWCLSLIGWYLTVFLFKDVFWSSQLYSISSASLWTVFSVWDLMILSYFFSSLFNIELSQFSCSFFFQSSVLWCLKVMTTILLCSLSWCPFVPWIGYLWSWKILFFDYLCPKLSLGGAWEFVILAEFFLYSCF